MPFNVANYDLVCIGSPVWAFAPSPAVNTYLDGLRNMQGKDALIFITYGSGTGIRSCLDKMEKALRQKGVFKIFDFGIQEKKVNYEDFVIEEISGVPIF